MSPVSGRSWNKRPFDNEGSGTGGRIAIRLLLEIGCFRRDKKLREPSRAHNVGVSMTEFRD